MKCVEPGVEQDSFCSCHLSFMVILTNPTTQRTRAQHILFISVFLRLGLYSNGFLPVLITNEKEGATVILIVFKEKKITPWHQGLKIQKNK